MAETIVRTLEPLHWQDVAAIANGAVLKLSGDVWGRLAYARAIVEGLIRRRIRGYGINTGVGALSDVIINEEHQQALSRNIIMSHACAVGEPFGIAETRAIMVAQINNFAHGASGIRPEVVDLLLHMLEFDCIPLIPSKGSVGYICHSASIGQVLIGSGSAICRGEKLPGGEALARIGRSPIVLQAKEGMNLVNGTPCATGLACLVLHKINGLLDWADAAAAMTYENLGAQSDAFADGTIAFRTSPGLRVVGRHLRQLLQGSAYLAARIGSRTQDPLSLRGIPQVHGAARDAFDDAARTVDRELASMTDNPAVGGTPEAPEVYSHAHAIGASLAQAMDSLGAAAASLGGISSQRIERLINPHLSSLPAFLADGSGVRSGYMIAQYAATSLVAENRRLAAPAIIDGGTTSALQEDILTHATPAATKALAIAANVELILSIELLTAAQAYECQSGAGDKAPKTEVLYRRLRARVAPYRDDRPMNDDFEAIRSLIASEAA